VPGTVRHHFVTRCWRGDAKATSFTRVCLTQITATAPAGRPQVRYFEKDVLIDELAVPASAT
jgi:hypothetical protein